MTVIEKNIKKIKNTYKIYLSINKKPIVKFSKTFKKAQKSKQNLLNLKFNTEHDKSKLFKRIMNSKFYFYFCKTFGQKRLLNHYFNEYNPEIFDLSFIDPKYKLHMYQLSENILNNF